MSKRKFIAPPKSQLVPKPKPEPAPAPPPPQIEKKPSPPTELEILTNDIRQRIEAADKYDVLARADIGRQMALAKPLIPHGGFEHWVKGNFSYGKRTAERAIALHHFRERHPQVFEKLRPLGLDKSHYLITKPIETILRIVDNTHVVGDNTKVAAQLEYGEMLDVLLPNNASSPADERERDLLRHGRALIRAIAAVVKDPATTAPDQVADLYDDLLAALAALADHYDLDDDDDDEP